MDGDPAGAVLSDPVSNPAGFVRGLVKSAFMTGDGDLIEGLEEAQLEKLIDTHCSRQLDLAASLLKDPTADMQTALDDATHAVEQVISRPAKMGDLAAANQRLILTQRLAHIAEDAKAILATEESKAEAEDVETESGMDTSTNEDSSQQAEEPQAEEAQVRSTEVEDMPPLKRTKSQIATTLKVQKVKKHTDDLSKPVNELARSVSKLAKQEVSSTTPVDALRAEMAAVEQARKRAVNFGEDLVEDMVQLDSLSGLNQEDREARKATLSSIEALLQDVDAAKTKLSGIHRKLEAQLKSLEAEEAKKSTAEEQKRKEVEPPAVTTGQPQKPSTPPTPRDRSEQAAAAAKAVLESPPPGKDVWTKVRLPLRFHSREERDHYSLAATCPGLDLEDLELELSEDSSTLTVAGLRVPSKQEAEAMRGRIAQKIRTIAQKAPPQRMEKLIESLPQVVSDGYVELGQGEFGRFAEKFRIPDDVNADSIDASYRDGILRVVLPKLSPQLASPYPRGGRYTGGHSRRSGYPPDQRGIVPGLGRAAAAPWGGSLFGGHDDFFRW